MTQGKQTISDRRIESALFNTSASHDPMEAVRILIEEAYRMGVSMGQMKERMTTANPKRTRTW